MIKNILRAVFSRSPYQGESELAYCTLMENVKPEIYKAIVKAESRTEERKKAFIISVQYAKTNYIKILLESGLSAEELYRTEYEQKKPVLYFLLKGYGSGQSAKDISDNHAFVP